MPKLRELTAVDVDYATSGPNHSMIRQAMNVPSSVLFNCLVDGPAWNEWLGIDVEWTSAHPFGVGTTRTVRIIGQTIEETFLAWDRSERLNFRFDRSTLPFSAFAEDYRVIATGDQSCELEWSSAYEWDGPVKAITQPLFAKGFALNCRRSLAKLKNLVEQNQQRFSTYSGE